MAWPVVDILTDRTAVLLQDRPVVGLWPGLVDAFIEAADLGLGVQLVTPATSRLTVPLRMALLGQHRWVVHAPGRGYVDGASGAGLRWDDDTFVEAGTPAGAGVTDSTERGGEIGRQLWLTIELRHERQPATFGLGVEAACRTLTGKPPLGWGPAEPVTQPWQPEELTELVIDRAPRPTQVTFVGGGARPAIGILQVTDAQAAPAQSAVLVVGYPAGEEPPLSVLPALADTLAREHDLALFFAVLRPGREDLTLPASDGPADGAGIPTGLAVGPAARGDLSASEALSLEGARPIGPRHRGTAWYDLPDGWNSLTALAGALRADVPLPVP
ncbi:DUF6177 family protein [Rugosimonospora africana]|uniref:Uncharacterized protein n=1 Tax=Rugosimonospora africana TaxID=556532 RepID=A0A8J3QWH9_9ACTN|nr:DUF6177 family protein [Rugosimonospora africana]GIH17654.1 hypothetical protein Raf01_58260 [Rugosimonospora africana]